MEKKLMVILGGGESGVGAAILAQKKEYRVFLSDSGTLADAHRQTLQAYQIDFEENGHTDEAILEASEIVKSQIGRVHV